jgi:hypothetical protein
LAAKLEQKIWRIAESTDAKSERVHRSVSSGASRRPRYKPGDGESEITGGQIHCISLGPEQKTLRIEAQGTTMNGRIMSLSSCSTMWQ